MIASGIGGVTTLLDAYDVLKEKGARRVLPLTVPMLMPNGPAALVGLELGARAGVHTPVSACASGAEAIAYGVDMIRTGRADVVVAGGTEAAIHPLPHGRLRGDAGPVDPQRRARAGVPALRQGPRRLRARRGRRRAGAREPGARQGPRRDHLRRDRRRRHHLRRPPHRPARPGRVGGQPAPCGWPSSRPARCPPTSSTSTRTRPRRRSATWPRPQAIRKALGDAVDGLCVSATKSMTGHLLGAAGAVETIATILALRDRMAPPTTNLEDPDDDVHLDVVRGEPRVLPDGEIAGAQQLVRLRRPQRRPGRPERAAVTHHRRGAEGRRCQGRRPAQPARPAAAAVRPGHASS